MTIKHQGSQRILVIGAGHGGTAMLELFITDPMVQIVGIMDVDPRAPAMTLARSHGIPNFTDLAEAIEASRPCIAFNLTGDDNITVYTESRLGSTMSLAAFRRVSSGTY